MVDNFKVLFAPTITRVEELYPGVQAVIGGEIGVNFLMMLFGFYILIVFLQKKRRVPLFMICLFSVRVAVALMDAIAGHFVFHGDIPDATAQGTQQIIITGIAAVIWIPYFLKSERVAATFTRP